METRGRQLLGWNASRLLVLGFALCAIACESDRERFEGHLERAAELLRTADPGPAAAVLELENARQLERDNPDVYYRLAEALRAGRRLPDAIAYYEETLHLDPDHVEAAVQLARLLRDRDPDRAKTLVARAVEHAPASGLPLAVRAELDLDRGDRDAALADANQSVALEPESSLGYWVLAEVHYERALAAQRAGEPIDPDSNRKGREALERYAELSGQVDPWSALPPLARFLALEPRYQKQAHATWRRLMDETAPEKAPHYIAQRGAQAALDLGREWRVDRYRLEALERLVELNPSHIGYWDELAGIRESLEGSGKETLEALIQSNPKNPEAHLRYVSYLRAIEGRSAAMAYLRQYTEDDELGPDILGALSELHTQAGETEEAQHVRGRLIEEYPSHPVTLLVQGREALARGDTAAASHLLGSLVEEWDHPEAASLLAHSKLARRDYPGALDAIARAIEVDASQRNTLLPLRAYAFAQMNQCERAIDSYARLYWNQRLKADDKIAFARCLYTAGNAERGLQLLLEAIREGDPQHEALFELVGREATNPALQDGIRQRLKAAQAVDPQNLQIATHLSDLDRKLGRHDEALARLEAYGERGSSNPEARLLRARLLFEAEDLAAARPELEALFRSRPYLKGILPLLVSVLLAAGDTPAALAALQRGERYSLLGPDRYVLYASLLLDQGDRNGALHALEKAYRGGVQDPKVMIQLALLQLREGDDPAKATHFAQLAVNWSGRSPEALSAMGLVLLERNLLESALVTLEEALATAGGQGDPALRAGTHYRLALALHRSGRADEAVPHFQRAHALDARIPAGPPLPADAESPP